MPDVSIVIPVYNEEENVARLCASLHESLSKLGRSYEVLLIDDGSADNSWPLLVEEAKKVPHFRLIRFRRNYGQTAAMDAGFVHAEGEIIVTLDADLQNDPADIPMLLEYMDKGADVVSGWRKDRKDKFISRRLPSMMANAIISKITGVKLHDYGCTLKAYSRDIAKNTRLYGEMHRFIPALASWVGGRIEEVVVNHRAREFGQSKYGINRTFRVVLDLITVNFLLRYAKGPIQLFGKLAAWFGAVGILIFVFVAGANISYLLFDTAFAADLIKRPFWVITPMMLLLFATQFISMGLLAEIQIRTYHESQDKHPFVVRETFDSPA